LAGESSQPQLLALLASTIPLRKCAARGRAENLHQHLLKA